MVSIVMFELWLFNFILLKVFPYLLLNWGVYGTMWIFGVFCLTFSLYVIIFMPETKGKSPEEIREILSK